ncbi:DUF4190 domain-containing protein [Gordonia alkaliphila]|uniref:DUF4190 domain-containing protein n=1 Tax=Gordonia alkaliphila TaxID=1053547 RepID=A0ABP8ZHV9_9ACTN
MAGAYTFVAIAVGVALWGALFVLGGTPILALVIAPLAMCVGVALAAETTKSRRLALTCSGIALLLGALVASQALLNVAVLIPPELLALLVPALCGLAWSIARSRDPLTSTLVAVAASLPVVLLFLATEAGIALRTGQYLMFLLPALPVVIAWVSAYLDPRSKMEFASPPRRVAPMGPQRIVVGHTADGQAVYGVGTPPHGPSTGPNGLAIASFVFGLTALSIVAVILGHMSSAQSKREGQPRSGFALAGIILGYITLAVQVTVVAWYVLIVLQLSAL